MPRKAAPVLNTIPTNPYNNAKDVPPDFYTCERCHRTIPSKNWPEHKNSKKHRALEDEERRSKDKENFSSTEPVDNGFGSGGDTSEPTATQDSWGSIEGDNTFGGATRGGGGRACHGCGDEGHIKRDW